MNDFCKIRRSLKMKKTAIQPYWLTLVLVQWGVLFLGCGEEPKFTIPEQPAERKAGLAPSQITSGSGPAASTPAAPENMENAPKGGGRRPETGLVAAVLSTPPDAESAREAASTPKIDRQTAEWAMWGGAPDRNMVSATQGITLDFDLEEKRLLWTANLGSQTYGNPIYAGGKVLVGTNNGAGHRPKYPAAKDMGILLCFDAADGKLLWQLSREKMPSGRVNDWPLQGICSAPIVEGDRLWVVTNRCEVMCLDLNGFHDGKNDGTTDEVDSEINDADILWTVDMYDQLGVFPHNLAVSSPVTHGDVLYLNTGNGVDEGHLEIPSPRAASFLGLNKNTGEVVFEDNSPEDRILHGQWSSPCIGVVNGKAQVIFAAGDGWMYSFDTETHELLWKFDLNPKENLYELGGAGTRCYIIGTPVFYENSVFLGIGQDPEHGEGVGHLWRVDATKSGDISPELGEIGAPGEPNPNSGVIWHYGGVDEEREPIYRRTMSTVAIHGGLVFAADLSGYLHCLDLKTGKRYWQHDLMAALWGSPLYLDGHVFLGDEDGRLSIFDASMEFALKRQKLESEIAEKRKAMKESDNDDEVRRLRAEIKAMLATVAPEVRESPSASSIYTTPTVASGVMYISDRSKLYAIQITKQ
jgi:outer membrane protein assembly factor BamB